MNFLKLSFGFTGTLLEVRRANEKINDWATVCCAFCVFRCPARITENATVKYLLSFLRPGWCWPCDNKENAANSRSWGKYTLMLAGGEERDNWPWMSFGESLVLEHKYPSLVIAWVQWLLYSLLSPPPLFWLFTKEVVLSNAVLSYLTPIGWSPKIRMNFEACR